MSDLFRFEYLLKALASENDVLIPKEELLNVPTTMCILGDEIWIGYGYPAVDGWERGVSRFSIKGELVKHYTSAPMDKIVNKIVSHDGVVWLGTKQGICGYSQAEDAWLPASQTGQELSGWGISGIERIDEGLCFGSNAGIAIYDPDVNHFSMFPFTPPSKSDDFDYPLTDLCADGLGRIWLLFDSSEKTKAVYWQGGLFSATESDLLPYPQSMKSVSREFSVIGGHGYLSILETASQRVVKELSPGNTNALVRAVCSVSNEYFVVVFFAVGEKLFSTYILKDPKALGLSEMPFLSCSPEKNYVFPYFQDYFHIPLSSHSGQYIYDLQIHGNKLYILGDGLHVLHVDTLVRPINTLEEFF